MSGQIIVLRVIKSGFYKSHLGDDFLAQGCNLSFQRSAELHQG